MKTYAEYLTSMTVKALHAICKAGGYKGYSKLRKAELVAFIQGEILIDWDGAAQVKILSTEVEADHSEIVKIMATVEPVTFSATPVKAPESPVQAPESEDAQESNTAELVYAYRAMKRTIRDMGNTPTRVKIVQRLRTLSAQLKALGMVPATL